MPEEQRPYHHGNLVPTLIETTIQLIEEMGVEKVTVREVAKRAGVSPGAPFRHFKSKSALLTAVAEQAVERLYEAVTPRRIRRWNMTRLASWNGSDRAILPGCGPIRRISRSSATAS